MSRRRSFAGMSTGTTMALVGAGVILVYLMTKKPTTTLPMYPGYPGYPGAAMLPPGGSSAATTTAAINAGASVANDLINTIFGGS